MQIRHIYQTLMSVKTDFSLEKALIRQLQNISMLFVKVVTLFLLQFGVNKHW